MEAKGNILTQDIKNLLNKKAGLAHQKLSIQQSGVYKSRYSNPVGNSTSSVTKNSQGPTPISLEKLKNMNGGVINVGKSLSQRTPSIFSQSNVSKTSSQRRIVYKSIGKGRYNQSQEPQTPSSNFQSTYQQDYLQQEHQRNQSLQHLKDLYQQQKQNDNYDLQLRLIQKNIHQQQQKQERKKLHKKLKKIEKDKEDKVRLETDGNVVNNNQVSNENDQIKTQGDQPKPKKLKVRVVSKQSEEKDKQQEQDLETVEQNKEQQNDQPKQDDQNDEINDDDDEKENSDDKYVIDSKDNLDQLYVKQGTKTESAMESIMRSPSIATITESQIMDVLNQNPDFYDHKAGRCICSYCDCGHCKRKCEELNSKLKKPNNLMWVSSYRKDFSDNSSQNSKNLIFNQSRQTSYDSFKGIENLLPAISTMRHDYIKNDGNSSKLVDFTHKVKDSPFYNMSTYKANFFNCGEIDPVFIRADKEITTHKDMPNFVKHSTNTDYGNFHKFVKEDLKYPKKGLFNRYPQTIDTLKRNSLKSLVSQCPQPKMEHLDTINQKNYQDHTKHIQKKKKQPNIQYKPEEYYTSIPEYQGQYKSSNQENYDNKHKVCKAQKVLRENYLKKLENYQNKNPYQNKILTFEEIKKLAKLHQKHHQFPMPLNNVGVKTEGSPVHHTTSVQH